MVVASSGRRGRRYAGINDDMAAWYVLDRDIDASGYNHVPIGAGADFYHPWEISDCYARGTILNTHLTGANGGFVRSSGLRWICPAAT